MVQIDQAFARNPMWSPQEKAAMSGLQTHLVGTALGTRKWQVHLVSLASPVPLASTKKRKRPGLLCMHGHGGNCCVAEWSRLFLPMSMLGYDIIAMDAPGFGQSSGVRECVCCVTGYVSACVV